MVPRTVRIKPEGVAIPYNLYKTDTDRWVFLRFGFDIYTQSPCLFAIHNLCKQTTVLKWRDRKLNIPADKFAMFYVNKQLRPVHNSAEYICRKILLCVWGWRHKTLGKV